MSIHLSYIPGLDQYKEAYSYLFSLTQKNRDKRRIRSGLILLAVMILVSVVTIIYIGNSGYVYTLSCLFIIYWYFIHLPRLEKKRLDSIGDPMPSDYFIKEKHLIFKDHKMILSESESYDVKEIHFHNDLVIPVYGNDYYWTAISKKFLNDKQLQSMKDLSLQFTSKLKS